MIQPQYASPYVQPMPAVNAVKIDIIEPKAYVPTTQQPAGNTYAQEPITAPMYNYPQASMYAQGAYQTPYMQYAQAPMIQQAPMAYAPEPQVMPESAMPAHSAPTEAPAAQATADVQVENQAPAQSVDVATLTQALASADANAQTDAITKIAQLSQAEPAVALQLVDEKVMQGLAQIIAADTSALAGPTPEQIAASQKLANGEQLTPAEQQLAQEGSPKEMAEKNKIFSMFTLAMLQKLQRDEIDQFNAQLPEGQNPVPPLKMQDMIGYSEIVNAVTTSQIPAVKVAGVQALSYAAKAEDAQTLQQILTPLTNDPDADVKQAAQEALAKLAMPEAAAGQAQAA